MVNFFKNRKWLRVERENASRSGTAFSAARENHMARGHAILIARGNEILRVTSDGVVGVVKRIRSPRKVKRGMKIVLR